MPEPNSTMTDEARYLLQQFEIAWKLTEYHLNELTMKECLWRPAGRGLHVYAVGDGTWRADWPDRETYDIGPPSIAWTTWHIGFWWSMVLNHSFGDGALSREEIRWPGDVAAVLEWLNELRQQWRATIHELTDADLRSADRTRWPFTDRPFGDVVAWANIELTKNAAEIGYARFLYAVRAG
jgi:hypothetical protein